MKSKMHLSLYRKYRPLKFDDVIGQEHITTTLKNQVNTGEISHAYLFTGSRGTGKTTCAKIFSRAINCISPIDGSPCGKCTVCEGLSQINNTDILEIDAASNNRVDEIRELRERVKYPAIVGTKKVYIIDEVHMLTDSAFNALLKTLEEPPENVVFILATTELHKLPATILSRCMKFVFKLVPESVLSKHLKHIFSLANITADEQSIELIARAAEGSVRDCLSIADSVAAFCNNDITVEKTLELLGQSNIDSILPLAKNIIDNDIKMIFNNINQLKMEGKAVNIIHKDLCDILRNMLLINNGVCDSDSLHLTAADIDNIKKVADSTNSAKIAYIFNVICGIELDIKYALDPQTMLESACVKASMPAVLAHNANSVNTDNADNLVKKVNNIVDDIDRSWGKILLDVRSQNLFALGNACKSIEKIEYKNEILYLHTGDRECMNLLKDADRLNSLKTIAKKYLNSIIDIVVEFNNNNKSTESMANDLKNLFSKGFKVE